MNPVRHAVRSGSHRGWLEFKQSLRSPQDQGFFLLVGLGVLAYLYFNRNNEVEFAEGALPFPTVALPSLLGGLIAFGMIIGPAYALAMEKEDGTLLRAITAPYGLIGHVTGHVVLNFASIVPMFLIVIIPGALLFDGLLPNGASGWWTLIWVTILGAVATLPIGLAIGSLVPGVQKMGTWGMLPFFVLLAISGIWAPIQGMWTWVQTIAQLFPMYWLGLGMRSAFLPESAAQYEITGSWQTGMTVLVLTLWAVAGLIIAPLLLRRMARRQSGSAVEAARQQAGQYVR